MKLNDRFMIFGFVSGFFVGAVTILAFIALGIL